MRQMRGPVPVEPNDCLPASPANSNAGSFGQDPRLDLMDWISQAGSHKQDPQFPAYANFEL